MATAVCTLISGDQVSEGFTVLAARHSRSSHCSLLWQAGGLPGGGDMDAGLQQELGAS